jgi:hypothetical protein
MDYRQTTIPIGWNGREGFMTPPADAPSIHSSVAA